MKIRRSGRGPATALLGALLVAAAGLSCSPDRGESVAQVHAGAGAPSVPAEPAPDFTLEPLGGGPPVSLSALRGKIVVLDFWATWCPPCEFQVPDLNAFYDAHRRDSDVAIFGISVDTEDREAIQSWVAEKGVRYPILVGGEEVARQYGAVGFPTIFVVGPDGTLRERHSGLIETATLERALAAQRAPDAS